MIVEKKHDSAELIWLSHHNWKKYPKEKKALKSYPSFWTIEMSRFLWTFYAHVSRRSFFFLKFIIIFFLNLNREDGFVPACVVACNMAHVQIFQLLSGLIGLSPNRLANPGLLSLGLRTVAFEADGVVVPIAMVSGN